MLLAGLAGFPPKDEREAAVDKKTLNLEEMKLKVRTGVKCGPGSITLYGIKPIET